MANIELTFPLARRSPIYLPRRDLVVDLSEALTLHASVIASDHPDAAPVNLSAAGSAATLTIWGALGWWDYGRQYPPARAALYTAEGAIVNAASGWVDFTIPANAGDGWPLRLGWTLRVSVGGGAPTAIGWGALQVQRVEVMA